ncbi:MAG: DegV family protein [Candidatus Gallimonas sp.]
MKIRITTDSTCDLGEEIGRRGIGVMPLSVILGGESFLDGVNITPQDIFDYVARTNELPKTACPSIADYEDFFRRYVEAGETVIHFNISAKASSAYNYAAEGAKPFGKSVYVVDSKALSSGQGLLVMKAADLAEEGKSAEEIYQTVVALSARTNTSFVPDRLDYLYKGGRCSRMAMYGANLLKIHPLIEMQDGQLVALKKYRGDMRKCIKNYIADLKEQYPAYDKTRCFITHSCADADLVETAKREVAASFGFDEVIETVAGSVITGHCGRNTLGVLFITE